MVNVKITGTGSYIPQNVVKNENFIENVFFEEDGSPISSPNTEVIEKLKLITGIEERKYTDSVLQTSDIGTIAAEKAIEDAGIDREKIDQIIVAHNFGDIIPGTLQTDLLPSIASRIKFGLGIKNTNCVPYDLIFGCPGWIQGLIHAYSFIHSGMAENCLVVGAETLSKIVDPHDRDAMIFSDGAGACIVQKVDAHQKSGFLSFANMSHAAEDTYYLYMGKSFNPEQASGIHYIKMHGRKIYEYALKHVPIAMKECLEKAGIEDIKEVKKIFIHQANAKMDEAIAIRLFKLYGEKSFDPKIVPMNISKFGNSSVATIPTLFDLVRKGNIEDQKLETGDIIVFASVGAGMNINAITYRY
jgi:3-oxoacyl-[acyl-carrier-protein] synthase III